MASPTTEIWKQIRHPFVVPYEVSNMGRVRNMDTKVLRKLVPNHKGYLTVMLPYAPGVRRQKRNSQLVHRLVMYAFVGLCPQRNQTNHRNGVKSDNRLENLEYVTQQVNQWHSNYVLGSGRAKLTRDQVLALRAVSHRPRGWLGEQSRRLGVSKQTVLNAVTGATYAFDDYAAAEGGGGE